MEHKEIDEILESEDFNRSRELMLRGYILPSMKEYDHSVGFITFAFNYINMCVVKDISKKESIKLIEYLYDKLEDQMKYHNKVINDNIKEAADKLLEIFYKN